MRIVSLLPSATEIICGLELEDSLVGVTHECDFPSFVRTLPKVTRSSIPRNSSSLEIDHQVREQMASRKALYQLDRPVLESLQPDLIITQALCDVCAVAEDEVRAAACSLSGNPHVINLEPQTLAQIFAAIRQVGDATKTQQRAKRFVEELTARVQSVARRSKTIEQKPRVALLEWLDPPFSCGHWNPELVSLAGGIEGLGHLGQPSRRLRWDDVKDFEPEILFIAYCGFNVERSMQDITLLNSKSAWHDLPAVRAGRVYVTDGSDYFNRPGPRLVDSLELLAHTLHPNKHPLPQNMTPATCALQNLDSEVSP